MAKIKTLKNKIFFVPKEFKILLVFEILKTGNF